MIPITTYHSNRSFADDIQFCEVLISYCALCDLLAPPSTARKAAWLDTLWSPKLRQAVDNLGKPPQAVNRPRSSNERFQSQSFIIFWLHYLELVIMEDIGF